MASERGCCIKITIQQDENVAEAEITVVCRRLDSKLEEILSYISLIDNTVTGTKNGETFFIPLSEILYFETVDRKVFFYTADSIYETVTKIYQLEEKLENYILEILKIYTLLSRKSFMISITYMVILSMKEQREPVLHTKIS